MTESINGRSKKILYMIMAATDYISLEQIAGELKLSKRSIYYEICKINEWLEAFGIPELEVTRGKGIQLTADVKNEIESVMESHKEEDNYVFSPTERVYVIICYIIHSETPIYVEELSEYCMVSRNTIFSDLRAAAGQLQEYDLKLEYDSRTGYHITGEGVRVRAIFFLYFNILHPLFTSGVLKFIRKEQIEKYLDTLKRIEAELRVNYVGGILLSLAALMPMMMKNDTVLNFPNLKKNELENTREYQLVGKYFPSLNDDERIYLCLHLLGSRVSVASDDIFDNSGNQSVYEMSKALVAEFEKVACVTFDDREDLERALFIHINTSMYRYNYGIQIGNPMREDIMNEYPNLFDITRIVCKYLEQQIGLPIPDGEVAYLALHFGAHLRTTASEEKRLRVLIVCVNGISTGNMLKSEIRKLLPDAKIVDVAAASDIMNIQNICDIVISTVKIKSLVPVIEVHPILRDFDRRNILNHPRIKGKMGVVDTNALFDIVKKYVPENNHASLKKELVDYFRRDLDYYQLPLDKEPRGLLDFLIKDSVLVTSDEYKWDQLIRFCGQNMVRRGSIRTTYLDSIISQIRYYGPYMFITPKVILAHAKPENGVNHLDVSMTILKNGVKFSEFHEARIVIVLAAEDQEKHLKILKDIMEIFSIESRVEELCELDTAEEVIQYMNRIL